MKESEFSDGDWAARTLELCSLNNVLIHKEQMPDLMPLFSKEHLQFLMPGARMSKISTFSSFF